MTTSPLAGDEERRTKMPNRKRAVALTPKASQAGPSPAARSVVLPIRDCFPAEIHARTGVAAVLRFRAAVSDPHQIGADRWQGR
jgi:hypothetical protein